VQIHTAAAGESFTTYNIEVEEDHTYHVGELGTWVHNESAERCLELAREAADGSEEAVAELRRIFSKAPKLRTSIDGQLREIVDGDLLRRIDAPATPRTGRYGDMVDELRGTGQQANHLNQKAAYQGIIPEEDGLSHALRGNALTEPGTPHFEFHRSLESFWNQYRPNGTLFGQRPTNARYGQALRQAL